MEKQNEKVTFEELILRYLVEVIQKEQNAR